MCGKIEPHQPGSNLSLYVVSAQNLGEPALVPVSGALFPQDGENASIRLMRRRQWPSPS
jgi:hypothetical protein